MSEDSSTRPRFVDTRSYVSPDPSDKFPFIIDTQKTTKKFVKVEYDSESKKYVITITSMTNRIYTNGPRAGEVSWYGIEKIESRTEVDIGTRTPITPF